MPRRCTTWSPTRTRSIDPRGVDRRAGRACRARRRRRSRGCGGLERTVVVPRIQKPGLALTGWPEQLHPARVLVLGGTEIDYLADHAPARDVGIRPILASDPACVVVCRGLEPPAELRRGVRGARRAAAVSPLVTADFIGAVTAWLADRLAPRDRDPRRAARRARDRRLDRRQERHRQERDRARSRRARPSARRRRRGPHAAAGRRRCSRQRRPASSATTWRSAASASSTSRTCSASRRCASQEDRAASCELREWDDARASTTGSASTMHEDVLERAVPEGPHAGAAGAQPRDARRGRGAQPAAQAAGHALGARVPRPARIARWQRARRARRRRLDAVE